MKNQIQQIETTRENNFRLLRMFSLYINERADFISPEMVREIASVGQFSNDEAFLLLFAEACGIHPTDGAEDSAFFREYLAPSVRRLNPEKYRSDPYYQRIQFPTVTDGSWELRNDCLKPYQTFIWDDVRPDDALRELPPLGYFDEEFPYPVVLENGREWMLVTPNEVETIRPAVAASHGNVVTFGLGLGYFPFMAAEKDDVERVTVIEKDPAAIRLFNQYLLPQFPHREKITIINEDAYDYLENAGQMEQFDFAYGDIWHDAGDGVPLYLRMNKYETRYTNTRFQYWIEETLLSYLRWMDFERMPANVRDPYRWLNNANTRSRARSLSAEEYLDFLAAENE